MNKKDFYKQKNKQKIIFASIITILILIVTFSSITLANTKTEATSKGYHKTAYIEFINYLSTNLGGDILINSNLNVSSLDVLSSINAQLFCIFNDCKSSWPEIANLITINHWLQSGNHVYRNTGIVAIGITPMTNTLHVLGDARTTDNTYLATSSGNVGIGTTSASNKLYVLGDARTTGNTYLAMSSGNVGIGTSSASNKLYVLGDARTTGNTYLATSSGNVGIGTTNPNPSSKVHINATSGTAFAIYDTEVINDKWLKIIVNGNNYYIQLEN